MNYEFTEIKAGGLFVIIGEKTNYDWWKEEEALNWCEELLESEVEEWK